MDYFQLRQITRIIIVAAVMVGVAVNRVAIDITYVMLFLTFLLSSQMRIISVNEKLYLPTILLDLIILLFMNYSYGSVNYLLFYILLLDSIAISGNISNFKVPTTLAILFFSYKVGYEIVILNLLVIILMYAFTHQFNSMREKILEIEALYDKNRKYSNQLEHTKKALEEYSKKVEYMAQLEERSRISIEIHDSIGHKLTALLMQMEAIMIVKETEAYKAHEMLKNSILLLRSCVDILRNTVKNIKPKKYRRGALALMDFIEEFSKGTGILINFSIMGDPYDLMPGELTALFKNLQEATTNAMKHGRARKIEVSLQYSIDCVILSIVDDGIGCEVMEKGMGITGMEERVSLFGGKITYESLKEGFRINTILPVHGKRGIA